MQRVVLRRTATTSRTLAAALLLAALSWVATPVHAEEAPSNLDVMRGLTNQAVEELVAKWGKTVDSRGVLLKPASPGEQHDFISNVLLSVLSERGITAYKPSGKETADALVLEFRAVRFNLDYPRVYRSWLIGGKQVERRAEVELAASIVDPSDGKVMSFGDTSRDLVDRFEYGELERVEEGNYQFTKPEIPAGKVGKFVEPVFVSGIVVGLIYLFFSNQSDN